MCSFSKLGIRWLQTMQCSLGVCPLKLSLLLSKVLLPREGNLQNKIINYKTVKRKNPIHRILFSKTMSFIPFAQELDPKPVHSKHIEWRTLRNQVGCRRWYCKARSHQPNPIQSLRLQQSSNWHRPQLRWQSAHKKVPKSILHLNQLKEENSLKQQKKFGLTSWATRKAATSKNPGRST